MVKAIQAKVAAEKEAEIAKQVAEADAKAAAPKNPAVEAADTAAASASLEINSAVNAHKEKLEKDMAAAEAKKVEIEKKLKNPPPASDVSGDVWTANMPEKFLK